MTKDGGIPKFLLVFGVVLTRAGNGSPDRIRTGVTGLRGRRPRPLDDGANKAESYRTLARGEGLEPSTTGPEPAVLPITPPPRAFISITVPAHIVQQKSPTARLPVIVSIQTVVVGHTQR